MLCADCKAVSVAAVLADFLHQRENKTSSLIPIKDLQSWGTKAIARLSGSGEQKFRMI